MDDRVRAYEDWLRLLSEMEQQFAAEWPNGELRVALDYDKLIVFWEFGEAGTIYREGKLGVFASNAIQQLHELDPDDGDNLFHENMFVFIGWADDDRVKSDIQYSMRHFWRNALEKSRIVWRAGTVATSAFDDLRK